jgi:formate dehydrogenase subunit gamma
MDTLDPTTRDRINAIIAAHAGRPGPLLEVLHEVQRSFGHIPRAAVPEIARGLNLSRAEVHGVVSFYHHFRSQPPGRHRLQICRAESCQAMNGEALAAHAERTLGVRFGETTADGRYSLDAVYCLGNCACSPAILLDDEPHGRVSPQRLDELLTEYTAPDGAGQ